LKDSFCPGRRNNNGGLRRIALSCLLGSEAVLYVRGSDISMASVGYSILVAVSLGAIISGGENEEERVARDVAAKEEQARKLREQAAALESQIATLKMTRCSLGREAVFGLVDLDSVKKQRNSWRSQPSVVTWTQDMRKNGKSAESTETARKALRDELLAKLEATWAEVSQFSAVC